MNRRNFLHAGAALAATRGFSSGDDPVPDTTLYNGIRLSRPWPPRWREVPAELGLPPYLATSPVVIPIDLGRQLLVDDFLVEKTDLRRSFHTPKPHKNTPVLRPETPWEREGSAPMAMVFSD